VESTRRNGHNSDVSEEHQDTDRFRGARFTRADLRDIVIRDSDLRGLKVTDSMVTDVNISGLLGTVLVNDVDVVPFVNAELDRRHPERVALRTATTPDDYRAAWDLLDGLWSTAVDRARALPADAVYERVDEEWSFVETLRHLVFATDAWAASTILDDPHPFHPLGLPHTSYPRDDAVALGILVDATPTFDEVLAVREGRMRSVRDIVAGLTEAELARPCTRPPAPGYPDAERPVSACLKVVFGEEWSHHQYATRDLAILESRA
jgi:hypothetical protein